MAWNDGLSNEQQNVAVHTGSHGRLLAGPGTGKTRTLTARIAYLIEVGNKDSNDIIAITFTRAAASELRNRVSSLLSNDISPPSVSTLHSFALSTLLKYGAGTRLPSPIRIADDFDERWIIEEDLKSLLTIDRISDVRDLISRLSAGWETLAADRGDWESRFPSPEFLGAWTEHRKIYGYTLRAELVYQLKLALEEGEIEFDECPSYVLIDEYQDLNACDLAIVKSLTHQGSELYVAGDDDQSIYGFRYANPEGIRRFVVEFEDAADLSLTECHRCSEDILRIASWVADQDTRRAVKHLTPNNSIVNSEVKLLRFRDYPEEARSIADICRWLVDEKKIDIDRILILLRTDVHQRFSGPIREALESEGLPAATLENPLEILYNEQGQEFLNLVRLILNLGDSLAWRVLMKVRNNHLGEQAFSHLYELARRSGVTFSEALKNVYDNPSLLERQGQQIKDEYESISNLIIQIRDAYENNDDFIDLLNWIFSDVLNDARWAEIAVLITELAESNEIRSLNSLLNILTTPPQEIGHVKVQDNINIMTMHQAKGLDADAVFIVAAEDEYIPGRAVGEEIDDERRLLYVSLTRARSYLYITHCNRRTGMQRHSGRTSGSGSMTRHLTQFLSGGPLLSQEGIEYINSNRPGE